MATEQKFKRYIKLSIGNPSGPSAEFRCITELKMVFSVRRFIGDSVHTMTIDIYNLDNKGDESNIFMEHKLIQLDAGYDKLRGTLFQGIINNVNTFRDGNDIITRIYCRDAKEQVDKMITVTYSKSTNLNDLLKDIAAIAGLPIARQSIAFQNTNKAIVINKPFSEAMKDLADTFKFRFYVFNGALYLFDKEKGNSAQTTYEISAGTGLLETPILTTQGMNVKMLMEPKIKPSDRFVVRSGGVELVQGGLEFNAKLTRGRGDQQVLSLVHTGDTHGDSWYTEIIGKVIKGRIGDAR